MKNKKLNLKLVGLDGNAFILLAHFSKEARKNGWSKEDIKEKVQEATSGDYSHLISVLAEC